MAKQTIVELARKRTFVLVKLGLEVESKTDGERVEQPAPVGIRRCERGPTIAFSRFADHYIVEG